MLTQNIALLVNILFLRVCYYAWGGAGEGKAKKCEITQYNLS